MLPAFFFWTESDLSTLVVLVLAETFTLEDFATAKEEEDRVDVALDKEEADSVDIVDFVSDDAWEEVLALSSTLLLD